MKQKNLILFFLLIFNGINELNAQNNSLVYRRGYNDGYKYGCQCYDLPTTNLAFSNGTYNEGYKDGKLDGVIYAQKKINNKSYNTSKPHDYNNIPLYKPDYEMLERTLVQKQNLLNQRRQQVKFAHENIIEIITAANERNNSLTDSQLEYMKWYLVQIDKISKYDFSIPENYNNVMNWLQTVKINVLKW
jgi:hypothetical protein